MLQCTKTQLKLRHGTWCARLTRRPLRKALGRTEMLRTLNTGDLREANRAKHRVLAELQEKASRLDERAAEAGLDASVERWLEGMARKFGTGPDGHPLLPATKERAARLAYRSATTSRSNSRSRPGA
jgi:hypothetical protein